MKPQPPLPEAQVIPANIVHRWGSLSPDTFVGSGLTRQDWDNLFFCLDHTVGATAAIQASLIAYSNGDMDRANDESWEASRRSIEAQNKLRQFMTGLMSSAV